MLTLTKGEHSVIPYPFIKSIPIVSKKSPNSGLTAAPPVTIFLNFHQMHHVLI